MNEAHKKAELPVEWKWKKLGEIADYLNGRAFKPNEWEQTGSPIIRIQNLNNPKANYNYTSQQFEEKYKVREGDLLFAWSASLGTYIWKGKDAWLNQHIFKIIPKETVYKKFLYYLLERIVQELYAKAHGSGMVHVTKSKFESTYVPIPPLSVQQVIVAKIEELLSELDKGIENLHLAQLQLKTYRQSVLKWAFEGKLTKEWRKRQIKLPSGELFLKQLRIEKSIEEKKNNLKSKSINPIEDEELLKLSDIPNEFAWVRLGSLLWSVKDGPHYSPKYQSAGVPFISGGNIRPNGIDFKNVKYISQELHEELSKRCKPEKGDVLYTKGGTTGIARVNTYDIDFNVWVHVAVLKTLNLINPFYLEYALNSTHCYKQSQKYTHGVGNQDLGLTRMILITLPICSLEEQNVIVELIENRLNIADKMNENIIHSLQQAEALKQSILKKAFEGKLV